MFWFDTIGLGDLTAYWGALVEGDTMANGTVINWSVGSYMAGFFPCMMCGIPGAALAMIQTAKSNKRKATIGIVGAAAVCAFLCGVTEPFEFAFMFLALPPVHCLRCSVRHLRCHHCGSGLPGRLLLLRRCH